MRSSSVLAFVLVAACGSSNSGNHSDASNGGGDGNGDSLGGNPTTVTVTLTNHPTAAATYTFLAAYQDGASAWQLAPAPSGDTYSFTINSPVWGFAWTCIIPGGATPIARVELAYFTVAEKTSLTEVIPNACTDRGTMNVGVSGTLSNTNGGLYFVDYATRTRIPMANGTWALEGPPGAHDLFAAHAAPGGGTASLEIDAVLRSTATGPQTGVALDWTNAVTAANATATGPTGATVSSVLYSAGNTQVTLGFGLATTLVGLGATQAMSGDIYQLSSSTRAQGSSETSEIWTSTFGDQTFTAPTPLGGATSSVPATTPYPIILTTWNGYANATGYVWDARQGTSGVAGPPMEWTAIVGPGYVGSMPRFQSPDLSMLTGWSTMLQLQTGQQVQGTVIAETSSAGASDFPTVNPAASGTTRTIVTSGWTVTP